MPMDGGAAAAGTCDSVTLPTLAADTATPFMSSVTDAAAEISAAPKAEDGSERVHRPKGEAGEKDAHAELLAPTASTTLAPALPHCDRPAASASEYVTLTVASDW